MDSKRTSHILLTIIAVGIFFMIFLYMKENYFDTPRVEPVVWEETVPARPSTTPTPAPIPVPTPTPTPVPTTASNIPLIARQNYYVAFGSGSTSQFKYCGERELYAGDDVSPIQYYYFLSASYDCADMEPAADDTLYSPRNMFRVTLKSTTSEAEIKTLNEQYSVSTMSKNGSRYTMTINSNRNPYNVYALAKIYFDSGLFTSTELFDVRFIN